MRALLVVLLLVIAPAVAPRTARAECMSSPSAAHSYQTRLSPRAGILCLYIADVYAGGACEGEPAWSVELSCGETSRLAVTDRGRLISILAPRASRPEWNIVRITTRDRAPVRIPLGDLPGASALRGAVRLDFDGGALRLRSRAGEVRVTFDALEALAEPTG